MLKKQKHERRKEKVYYICRKYRNMPQQTTCPARHNKPSPKAEQRARRLPIVEALLLRGFSLTQIRREVLAQRLQEAYSIATASRDVALIHEAWAAPAAANEAERQRQVMAAHDRNRELWTEWEKTRNPALLVEVRRNDEHIADLLQLKAHDITAVQNSITVTFATAAEAQRVQEIYDAGLPAPR